MTSTPPIPAPRWTAYMPLNVLTPATRNPKLHEITLIQASIRDHGFVENVLVDERTGRTIAGHGRREALIEMYAAGEPMPAGLILDEDGTWLLPVTRGWSSRTDADAEALIIKLNRITTMADWDNRMLAAILEDLVTTEPDLYDSLAYSDEEMENLLRAAPAESLGEEPAPLLPGAGTDDLFTDNDSDPEGLRLITCPTCGDSFTPRQG
ncbi:ParB N-terminal domain-containing protein [Kitasatospora sp. NPDC088548]|uniref:ParB N-terminal domain-containing protein n=1 Tax=Kitasatospora sp. NPDC088548 TaxID=3364075 RepID=UPI00381EBC53